MASQGYVLVVALYADADEAVSDLRDLTAAGGMSQAVAGSGILHRDWRRSMLQQGSGGTLAYGIGTGAAAGIVAGVFVGMPLLGAAAGAVVGGVVGRRMSRREVEGLVALLDDAIPVGATALLAVVEEDRLHGGQDVAPPGAADLRKGPGRGAAHHLRQGVRPREPRGAGGPGSPSRTEQRALTSPLIGGACLAGVISGPHAIQSACGCPWPAPAGRS